MLKFNLDTTIQKNVKANFLMDFPTKKRKKHPLIIYLHGAGERDVSPEDIGNFSIRNEINEHLGFAILTPHCPPNEIWDEDIIAALVKDAINFGNIDPKRIYLTGVSMGARGVWNAATSYPDLFTALAPISGFSYYLKAAKIAKVPTWIFHGKYDNIVPFEESYKMFSSMKEAGGNPRFSTWEGGHSGFYKVYDTEHLYLWMLEHTK